LPQAAARRLAAPGRRVTLAVAGDFHTIEEEIEMKKLLTLVFVVALTACSSTSNDLNVSSIPVPVAQA